MIMRGEGVGLPTYQTPYCFGILYSGTGGGALYAHKHRPSRQFLATGAAKEVAKAMGGE